MPRKKSAAAASPEQLFRIGALERMTGVPTMTIRVWELRHGALQPQRTSKNGRLYDLRQVRRLTLLRDLTKAGHAISTVAGLSEDDLVQRLQAIPAVARAEPGPPLRVALVGMSWTGGKPAMDVPGMAIVSIHGSVDDARRARPVAADVVVVEVDVVETATLDRVEELRSRVQARGALVVYELAQGRMLDQLHRAGVPTLRGPLSAAQLRTLLSGMFFATPDARDAGAAPGAAPPRRFSGAQLQEAALSLDVLRCECPQHLADLIRKIAAFETYSRQCELENREDALVHGDLHASAAQARRLLEDALQRVLDHSKG